jgi:hypothetical protein
LAQLVTDELLDKSVHAICFEMGGTTFTKAHIEEISVRLDGKDLVPVISGTNLQKINTYDGLPDGTNYIWYFFGEPTAQTIRGQHLGDLDLSIYRKPLEIKVKIGAATAPELRVHALVGVPKLQMNIGYTPVEAAQIRALVRTVVQPAGAVNRGTFGINWGSVNGARIRQVNFLHANITSVEYKKNSLTKHDDISTALNTSYAAQYARTAQSGLYVLDRVLDGNQGEAETTVDADGRAWNQQFSLTTSAADTINVYTDVHAAWPLL